MISTTETKPHLTQHRTNPFSGLVYSRAVALEKRDTSVIIRSEDDYEAQLRGKIHSIFCSVYQNSSTAEYHIRNPVFAPLTADLRIDHRSGAQIFVEIKTSHAKVEELWRGGRKFSHVARSLRQSKAIFQCSAPWDYLFTLLDRQDRDDGLQRAIMINKDDIPENFWHSEGDDQGWLSCEFPDSNFLDMHTVDLNRPAAVIVQRIKRIMGDTGNGPKKATKSSADIRASAGPLPWSLMSTTVQLTDSNDEGGDNDEEEGLIAEGRTTELTDAEGDPDVTPEDGLASSATPTTGRAQKRDGERVLEQASTRRTQLLRRADNLQNEQYFIPILRECRRRYVQITPMRAQLTCD